MHKKLALGVLILILLSLLLWSLLKERKHFWILYPLETTSQYIHIYDGLRFLGIDDSITAYAAVLNNPIESGGYADIAIFFTCNSGNNVALSVESARTRSGEAAILTGNPLKEAMRTGEVFETAAYPKALTPRMQEYGCAPVKSKNSLTPDSMDHLQQQIVTLYQAYRNKDVDTVIKNIHTAGSPEAVDGGIFRLRLPDESTDTPLLINLKVNLKHHTLRFQLQKLD